MKLSKAWLKALSGLSINLSAAWFATALIGVNIAAPKEFGELLVLTFNLVFGIIFLLLTVKFEENLEK